MEWEGEVEADVVWRVLRFDLNHDRHMAGMRVRPGFHLGEALDQRRAVGAKVDVLDVQHLESRRLELGDAGFGSPVTRRSPNGDA